VTDSEYPDSFRGLFDELGADPRPDLAASSAVPENGWSLHSEQTEAQPAVGFTSRRAMREAGGYAVDQSTPPSSQAVASRPAPTPPAVTRSVSRTRPSGSAKRGRTRDAVRTDYTKPAPKTWRRKLSSAGVMTVVIGLFATVTIPAFADQDALAPTAEQLDAQTLEVTASTSDQSASIRDSYSTTNAADLRKLYAEAVRQQNLAAYLASGAREMGDDYPWPDQLTIQQGGGLSPFNYYYRECVDFVAWRMNRDAGVTSAPWKWVWTNLAQGSAWKWKNEWIRHGWATGPTPVVGAVAWFPGGNHVAYVSGILPDGSVAIEEYNWGPNNYGQRIIPAGSAYYLYAPPG
jgi:peptidoglycan DL-endopeptidase CwlO